MHQRSSNLCSFQKNNKIPKVLTFHRPLCDLTWSIRVDQYKKEMKIISHDLKKKIRIKRV